MINLWFVFICVILRSIQDCWLRKSELTYRDNIKPDVDKGLMDRSSTWITFGEFGFWYIAIFATAYFYPMTIREILWNVGAITWLVITGWEDLIYYFIEPLFKHPNRDIRYATHIGPWRMPKDFHYLGAGDTEGHSGWHNPLMMLFGGKSVSVKGFFLCNLFGMAVLSAIYFL